MPFKKVGQDDYTSPSGRHFNEAQVRLWHANGDKFPGEKTSEAPMSKMNDTRKEASYANGGVVLGRTKDFIKQPDRFRDSQFKQSTEDNFGKSGGDAGCAPPAKGKSLPVVKPHA